MPEIDRFIVEIQTEQDRVAAGTGFVISDSGHIATAHHVVCDALGLSRKEQFPPDLRVPVYFHQSGTAAVAKILAEYQNAEIDVSILQVDALPEGVLPALMGTSTHSTNHQFNSKGYRPRPPYTGLLASGEILGQIDTPGEPAVKTLQLRSGEINLGMSGAPVVDATIGLVVGMTLSIWNPEVGAPGESRDALTAFALSSEGIKYVYPDLQLSESPQVPGLEGGYDHSLRDYLRAVRDYCASHSYLTLDELIGSSNGIYIPLHVTSARAQEPDQPTQVFGIPEVLSETTRNEAAQILIVGEPGAGKSTLLRHIAEHSWDGTQLVGLSRPHIPMIVAVHELTRVREASIEELLRNAIKASGLLLHNDPPDDFLTQWPRRTNSRWFFLLDGLDQVSAEDRAKCNRKLHGLFKFAQDGGHQVLVTSRPSGLDTNLQAEFQVYHLAPFSAEEQTDFARAYFGDRAEEFRKGMERLGGSLLLGTPLLLTIAAGVFRKDRKLPRQRAGLYRRFIEISIAEARERGLEDEIGERMTKFTSRGLQQLALHMLENPEQVEADLLIPVAADFLHQALNLTTDEAEIDGEKFLQVLGRQSGILLSRDHHFEWVHRTFAEYLAASAVSRRHKANEENAQQWVDRWSEENWREVVLFLLGIWSEARQDVTHFITRIWKSSEAGLLFVVAALADGALVSQDTGDGIRSMLRSYVKEEGFLEFLAKNPSRLSALDAASINKGESKALLSLVWDHDANEGIRLAAIRTLGELGRADDLISAGQNASFASKLRVLAAEELGKLGRTEDAVSILLPIAQDAALGEGRWEAADALAALDRLDEAAAVIVDLVRDATSLLEAQALIARLGRFQRADELWTLAHDKHLTESVRADAIESLHGLGQPGPLLALAQDDEFGWEIRIAAATAVGQLGSTDDAARVLVSLAHDRKLEELADQEHEDNLRRSMPEFVESHRKIWEAVGWKGSPFPSGMRVKAVEALLRIRHTASLQALARDGSVGRRIQASAVKSLSAIGRSEGLLPIVIALLHDRTEEAENIESRKDLVATLGNIHGAESLAELISIVRSDEENSMVRGMAAKTLAKLNQVEELLALARDVDLDSGVRWDAVEALVSLSVAEGSSLIAHDADSWTWRRIEAAKHLRKLGQAKESAAVLVALEQDQTLNETERQEAGEALAELTRSQEAAPVLMSLARNLDVEAEIRRKAIWDLHSLGNTVDLLLLMNDSGVDPEVRATAIWALEVLGHTNAVLAAANSPGADSVIRLTAIAVTAHHNQIHDALALLLPFLRDERATVEERAEAVVFLGRMDLADKLLAVCRDTEVEDEVSNAAVKVLASLGKVQDLLTLIGETEGKLSVRFNAALVLGPLGKVEELLSVSRNSELAPLVRVAAAWAASAADPSGEAISILRSTAYDEAMEPGVRKEAARALSQFGKGEDGAAVLLALASNSNVGEGVRASAALILKDQGRNDDAAASFLSLARDAGLATSLRTSAVVLLREMSRAQDLDLLLRDSTVETDIRISAARMFGEIGRIDELVTTLNDEAADVSLRVVIARALGLLSRVDDLLSMAHQETANAEVRIAAASALSKLGHAEELSPILLSLGQDKSGDGFIRLAAALVLRDIGQLEVAANLLLGLAQDPTSNLSLRTSAVEALGKAGRVEELMVLARDHELDGWVSASTAGALLELERDEEAVSLLLSLAGNAKQSIELRVSVIDALAGVVDNRILPCFENLAINDSEDEVCKAAKAGIVRLRQSVAQSSAKASLP